MTKDLTDRIDTIIKENEDFIYHWIETGKTVKWIAQYLMEY